VPVFVAGRALVLVLVTVAVLVLVLDAHSLSMTEITHRSTSIPASRPLLHTLRNGGPSAELRTDCRLAPPGPRRLWATGCGSPPIPETTAYCDEAPGMSRKLADLSRLLVSVLLFSMRQERDSGTCPHECDIRPVIGGRMSHSCGSRSAGCGTDEARETCGAGWPVPGLGGPMTLAEYLRFSCRPRVLNVE
jgi:hypothetical protein